MAGAAITIDLRQLAAMNGQLDALVERSRDLTPLMDRIGLAMETTTHERFESESGPDGRKWKPSQRVKAKGGKTLTKSGRLDNSVTHKAAAEQVEIGTNVIYARPHQLGWPERNLPARPFLGLGGDDEQSIAELTSEYLFEALAA